MVEWQTEWAKGMAWRHLTDTTNILRTRNPNRSTSWSHPSSALDKIASTSGPPRLQPLLRREDAGWFYNQNINQWLEPFIPLGSHRLQHKYWIASNYPKIYFLRACWLMGQFSGQPTTLWPLGRPVSIRRIRFAKKLVWFFWKVDVYKILLCTGPSLPKKTAILAGSHALFAYMVRNGSSSSSSTLLK